MATYIRRDSDVRYRKVSLKMETVPPLKSFTAQEEAIAYTNDQVLEVEDKNGKRVINYAYPKLSENGRAWNKNNTAGGCRVTIIAEVSPARLWVNVKGALYKIPVDLPEDDNGNFYFDMPLKINDFEITGDEYFNAAYGAAK